MMKIRTFKFIDNNVYRGRIYTEDWSQNEKAGIHKFSDPEINLGGTFCLWPAVTGTHTSVDVRDYIVDDTKNQGATLDFRSMDLVGRMVHNITQNFWGVVSGWGDDPTTVIFVSTDPGNVWNFGDAYEVMSVCFVLPDRYRRLMADSPFNQSFDARTYNASLELEDENMYVVPQYYQPVAKLMSEAWAAEIVARIESSVAALRAKIDGYTGEEVVNV